MSRKERAHIMASKHGDIAMYISYQYNFVAKYIFFIAEINTRHIAFCRKNSFSIVSIFIFLILSLIFK